MPNMGGQFGRGGRFKPSLESLSIDYSNSLARNIYAAFPMTENGRIFHNATKSNDPNRKLTMTASSVVGAGLFGGPGLTSTSNTTYCNTALSTDFDFTTKFTIVLWARFTNVGAINELVFRSQDGTSTGFEFMTSAAAHLQLIGYHSTPTLVTGTITLVTGRPYCLALTYDSTANQSKLYVDGRLDVTGAGNIITGDGSDQLAIGGANGVGGNFLHGSIDNPIFWSRTLSQAEIMRLVANPFEIYTYNGAKTNINSVPLQSASVPLIMSGPLSSNSNVTLNEASINTRQVQVRSYSKANGPVSSKIFLPTGCVNGDILVTVIAWDDVVGNIPTTATGWTLLQSQSTGSVGSAMYYKVASGEPASITWTTGSDTIGTEYCVQNGAAPDGYTSAAGASTTSFSLSNASHLLIGAFSKASLAGISAPLNMTDGGNVSRGSTNNISQDTAFTTVTAPGAAGSYSAGGSPDLAQIVAIPQTNLPQNQPLFVLGPVLISSGVPLFVLPNLVSSGSPPLFVTAANMRSSGTPLFALVANIQSGSPPLYVLADSSLTGTKPLYTVGLGFQSQSAPLFTENVGFNSGNFPLFVWGNLARTSGTPLCTAGPSIKASGISLYAAGSVGNQSFQSSPLIITSKLTQALPITLILRVKDPLTTAGLSPVSPLFTFGGTPGVNSFFDTSPLYLEASHGQQPFRGSPLYMLVPTVGSTARNIPLYMKVDTWLGTLFGAAPLYINTNGASQSIPAFIQGLGTTPGALPINLGTPLFIARGANAAGGVNPPLFLQSLQPFSSSITLYVNSNLMQSSGTPLVIPQTKGLAALTLPISINGY